MKTRISALVLVLLFGAAVLMTGCGRTGASQQPPPPPPPSPPAISSISPSSVTAGQAGFTLTVNGSNFAQGAVVQWNGSDRPTTFVSASQLTTAIPGSDLVAPGTAAVQVRNPASPPLSNAAMFTIQPANPTPVISSLSPPGVLVGGPDFTLTVNGTNFVSGAVVQWNGSGRATAFLTSSQLNAAISASDVSKSGNDSVTVVNPGSSPSSSFPFFVSDPTPSITSLAPPSAVAGGQAFALTVNGTNFVGGALVAWDGNTRTTTFGSSTQLTAAITASDIALAETAAVFVLNPFALQPSNTLNDVVNNPMPAIASLSPSSVMAGAAPFTLTVNGTNFVSGAVVQWNGSSRATTFVTSSQLHAAISASDVAAQGNAQVTVVNVPPSVGLSAAAAFTIGPLTSNPVPSLSSLSDTSAPAGWPGFPLTVNGTGFVAATTGQWNGLNRTTSVQSSEQLKSAIPLGDLAAVGTSQVGLFNPSPGGGASNAVSFSIKSVAPGAVGVIERSSVATDLTEANSGSGPPAFSADGRFVVFASAADNLVRGDTNGVSGVFLRDTCLGAPAGCVPTVVRVSVASDGAEANRGGFDAAISANGRYVAFSSAATNLVPGVTFGNSNVFVRDTCFGAPAGCQPTTTLASSDVNDSFEPSLSADGRYVAFTNGTFGSCGSSFCEPDAFVTAVRDTCAGAAAGCNPSTVVVSDTTTSDPAARISADGRFVAFSQNVDVFLRDTCQGAPMGCRPSTVRVSVAGDGTEANQFSAEAAISANGRYVAFTSPATNLVAGDTNGVQDVFVRDTCFGASAGCISLTIRVSIANDGSQSNGNSLQSSISADGRFVAFISDATNLVAGDTSPFPKIFLRDTCLGISSGCTPSTVRLSVALDGTPANNQTVSPMLNGNARYVVFLSLASNLAPGDTNQAFDVFVARTNVP